MIYFYFLLTASVSQLHHMLNEVCIFILY